MTDRRTDARADGGGDAVQDLDDRPWWKETVVYQVYPRSFQDSDGDGVGDLRGLRERVDHLVDLGVGAVWLCPIYDSPGVDNGYDVRDYRAVDSTFGTMADFEALVDRLHAEDIRLVTDVVFNHTSDEHEWFQRSRDPDSPYRDWYYWREGRAGGTRPPNNWESLFGGSAWTRDDRSGEWYLHLFSPSQPDLNWRTPAVRDACIDVLEFWLDRGVDGFRFDVLNLLSKREGLPDGDPDPIQVGGEHFLDGPRVHEYVAEIHDRALAGRDLLTVAEMGGVSPDEATRYLRPDGDGLAMLFAFDHLRVDHGPDGPWDVREWDRDAFCDAIERWQTALDPEWPALFLGNHDEPRVASRFGDGSPASAKLFATVLLTLRGTPFVYQGDELGMTNYPWTASSSFDDVASRAVLDGRQATFLDAEDRLDAVRYRSRDNARTPMQWSTDEHAGFTDGDPWLPVNPDYERVNAATQRDDPASVLSHYCRLIRLRQGTDVLVSGRFERVAAETGVFAYTRTLDDERVLVGANLTADARVFEHPDALPRRTTQLVGTHDGDRSGGTDVHLRPWEAFVSRLGAADGND